MTHVTITTVFSRNIFRDFVECSFCKSLNMFTASYSQDISAAFASHLNSQVSGHGGYEGTRASEDFFCNGECITTEPTRNHCDAPEALYGSRDSPRQREKDLQLLQLEVASLKNKCHEKEKEIVYLNDKLSKMKDYHHRRESEFNHKMEETVRQLTKVKNTVILTNEKFIKKNSECEDLKTKLQAAKEREVALEKQNSCLEEEIKLLHERLTKLSEDRPIHDGSRPCLKDGTVESTNESRTEDNIYQFQAKYPLFLAKDYFDLQPSEFDFLTNTVIANGPFYSSSLRSAIRNDEIAKGRSPDDNVVQEFDVLGQATTLSVKEGNDYPCEEGICNTPNMQQAGATAYLNSRPLPAIGAIENYHINETTNQEAVRYLNNRPMPTEEYIVGTYHTPWMPMKEDHGGFLGKTINQWFGF